MVQYYTLEQAAEILRTTPDEVKELARKKAVRAFQDRGTLRFRAQEIDELARSRGYGSDPDLPLGEAARPPRSGGARPTTHAPAGSAPLPMGRESPSSEEVPLGKDPPSSKSGRSSSRLAGKSPPKASSDSDVRLVLDKDLDFHIDLDSGGQVVKDKSGASPRPSHLRDKPSGSPPPGGRKSSRLGPSERVDSGVRMVPLEGGSDSDVKVKPADSASRGKKGTGSDSDIRVQEQSRAGKTREPEIVTEEIDLDAEARRAEEAARARQSGKGTAAHPALPTSSPFELSSLDVDVGRPAAPASGAGTSSDFELAPMGSDESLDLNLSDEVDLGPLNTGAGSSGINLQEPVDSGLSLEEGGSGQLHMAPLSDARSAEESADDSSSDFELSLDGAEASPTDDSSSDFELSLDGGEGASTGDSSSDFELSLDGAEASPVEEGSSSEFELTLQDDMAPAPESSSEFELTLDGEGSSPELTLDEGAAAQESDSEFELTLDESGSLSPGEEGGEEGQDIFETDFDVPSLDEESGSEAVALDEADTDLESSELDMGDEESGSQVVPLEEEEADEGETTRAGMAAVGAVDEEEGFDELDEDLDQPVEEEELEEEAVGAPAAAPAPWGVFPALVLMPTCVILFLVALMSFELFQGMWGFHKGNKVSNLLIDPIARMMPGNESLPKD